MKVSIRMVQIHREELIEPSFGSFTLHETEQIIRDCVQLGPYLEAFQDCLLNHTDHDFEQEDIYISDIIKAVTHSRFVEQIPGFSNRREGQSNIKLLIHAFILLK